MNLLLELWVIGVVMSVITLALNLVIGLYWIALITFMSGNKDLIVMIIALELILLSLGLI